MFHILWSLLAERAEISQVWIMALGPDILVVCVLLDALHDRVPLCFISCIAIERHDFDDARDVDGSAREPIAVLSLASRDSYV
jgi:hypothetical protein